VTQGGRWAPGTYELALLVDGQSASCALKVPAMPSTGPLAPGSCTSTIGLTLAPEAQCTGDASADGSDDTTPVTDCAASAGAFQQVLTLPDMPATVVLTLTRDGNLLVQQTIALTYADVHPNGPSCGPTCHEAAAVMVVAHGGG
jgi:hypothetical protein